MEKEYVSMLHGKYVKDKEAREEIKEINRLFNDFSQSLLDDLKIENGGNV